jgi:hypothetical protein
VEVLRLRRHSARDVVQLGAIGGVVIRLDRPAIASKALEQVEAVVSELPSLPPSWRCASGPPDSPWDESAASATRTSLAHRPATLKADFRVAVRGLVSPAAGVPLRQGADSPRSTRAPVLQRR